MFENSHWRWACGLDFERRKYTPLSFLKDYKFLTRHLHSQTHQQSAIWFFECEDRIKRGVKVIGEHFWVIMHNVYSSTASTHYDPSIYLLHALGADIGDTQLASNIANTYLQHIHSYLNAIFSTMVLYGKRPKTNWPYYMS